MNNEITKVKDNNGCGRFLSYGHYCEEEDMAIYYRDKFDMINSSIDKVIYPEFKELSWQSKHREEILFCASGFPYTAVGGLMMTTTDVIRLKKIKEEVEALISTYGENVALRRKHTGMGTYKDELILLKEGKPDSTVGQ